MPILVGDFVLQTANSPGTGTFNLIAPVAGRRSFVSMGSTAQVFYVADDGTSFEEGYGTVTAGTPDTLSRDTVLHNSLGTTAKINFTGSVNLYSDVPAERVICASPDGGSVYMGNRVLNGVQAGYLADHAPRMDQVGWQVVAASALSTSVGDVHMALSAGYQRFRLEIQDAAPVAAAQAYVRFSFDGGTTYLSGTTDYAATVLGILSSGTVTGGGASSFLGISAASAGLIMGHLEFPVGLSLIGFDVCTLSGSALYRNVGVGRVPSGSTPTHILFGFVGTNVAQHRIRLLGGMS